MVRPLIVLVFIASAGIGWLSVPHLSPSSPELPPASGTSVSEAVHPAAAPDPRRPRFEDLPLEEQLERIRESEEIPAAVPVTARIGGHVLNADGEPAAARIVVAIPLLAPLDPRLPLPAEAEYLRRRWRALDWATRHRREVTTAEDGSFDIDGLVGASYRIEVRREREGSVTAVEEPVEPGWWLEIPERSPEMRVVEVVIERPDLASFPVLVTVRPADAALARILEGDPDWRPRASIPIPVPSGDAEAFQRILSADSCLVLLSPGSTVRANCGSLETETVSWNGRDERIVLRAHRASSILLRTRLPAGSEKVVRAIGLLALGSRTPLEPQEFSRRAEWRKLYGMVGEFPIPIEPGTYQIGVRLGDPPGGFDKNLPPPREGPVDGWGVVTVSDSPAVLEIRVGEPDPGDGIIVEVRGPDGELRSGQRLRLSGEGANGQHIGSGYRSDRLSDGTYLLTGFSEGIDDILRGRARGEVRVHTHDQELGPRDALVAHGAIPRAVLVFPAPGLLIVDCGELDPDLRRRLSFSVRYDGEQFPRRLQPVRDDGGRGPIELRNVAPGRGVLEVSVGALTIGQASFELHERGRVSLAADCSGLHRVEFLVENGGRVYDIVLGDGREAGVHLSSFAERSVQWLPAGAHVIVDIEGRVLVRFSVPAEEPVTIGREP